MLPSPRSPSIADTVTIQNKFIQPSFKVIEGFFVGLLSLNEIISKVFKTVANVTKVGTIVFKTVAKVAKMGAIVFKTVTKVTKVGAIVFKSGTNVTILVTLGVKMELHKPFAFYLVQPTN